MEGGPPVSTTSVRRRQIVSSLQDKEYRDALADAYIGTALTFQIRAMRQARGWTRAELAERAGMAEATIALLENPNHAKFTLRTLKRLASAFDVAPVVRFVPFSQLVDWIDKLSTSDLAAPSFEHDAGLLDCAEESPDARSSGTSAEDASPVRAVSR